MSRSKFEQDVYLALEHLKFASVWSFTGAETEDANINTCIKLLEEITNRIPESIDIGQEFGYCLVYIPRLDKTISWKRREVKNDSIPQNG